MLFSKSQKVWLSLKLSLTFIMGNFYDSLIQDFFWEAVRCVFSHSILYASRFVFWRRSKDKTRCYTVPMSRISLGFVTLLARYVMKRDFNCRANEDLIHNNSDKRSVAADVSRSIFDFSRWKQLIKDGFGWSCSLKIRLTLIESCDHTMSWLHMQARSENITC